MRESAITNTGALQRKGMPCPPEPLPPPLSGSDEGSFAQYTVRQRLAGIVRRVIAENAYPDLIVRRLQGLADELPDGRVRPLHEDGGPDLADWALYLQPYVGQTWRDIPWYVAEAYLYRRVLEATRYFSRGPWYKVDPYAAQKKAGLAVAMDAIRALSAHVNDLAHKDGDLDRAGLILLIHHGLWGNRADLSMWPARQDSGGRGEPPVLQDQANILVDDTARVVHKVAGFQDARVDFIMDNAGFELVTDLGLADYLVTSGAARAIWLHAKAHPTFVSDTMIKDVYETIATLAKDEDQNVRGFALRLEEHVKAGRIHLREDFFWTSPLVFWDMPDALRSELSDADLVIVKGDANYRRLLGDRHWPFTTPFEEIVCYFPTSLVALRALKAEVACGLKPGQPESLRRQDPQWLTDGRWGVIQFLDRD